MNPLFPVRGNPGDVVRLLQAGQFDQARRLGTSLLYTRHTDVSLLQLTAIAALQSGAAAEGISLLRRALAIRPGDPTLRFNLAKALGDAGAHEEALRHVSPGDGDHLRLRAELLRNSGQHRAAREAYERLVAADPANPELRNNLATACLADNDPQRAIAELERARTLGCSPGVININLAKAYGALGQAENALAAASEAVRIEPDDPRATLELARAYVTLGRQSEALPLLVGALERHPQNTELMVEIGIVFVALDEFARAEDAYRLALKHAPGNPAAVLNLGNLLEQDNRLDELAAHVQAAETAELADDGLAYLKAQLARRRGDLETARALVENIVDHNVVTPGFRAQLVGQIADRQGDFAAAFDAFVAMNAATRENQTQPGFAGHEYLAYVNSLRAGTPGEWWKSWPQITPPVTPSPAFLVGFPRSGTTLLDTVLMGHPQVHVLEEEPVLAAVHEEIGNLTRIPELSESDVIMLRDAYFAGVAARSGGTHGKLIVDKLPLNLMRAPLIHRLFPEARFILALRHPCDSVLSCFMQNFRVNRAMASFWTIESAARTYDAVFDFWEHCRGHVDLAVRTIRYEDLVSDLEGTVRPLVEYLGLDWESSVLDFQRTARERRMIQTPSYAQVTEGLYQRARGRWEHYREFMDDALPLLAPWATRFGYGDILSHE